MQNRSSWSFVQLYNLFYNQSFLSDVIDLCIAFSRFLKYCFVSELLYQENNLNLTIDVGKCICILKRADSIPCNFSNLPAFCCIEMLSITIVKAWVVGANLL